jgi:hypothetical protein
MALCYSVVMLVILSAVELTTLFCYAVWGGLIGVDDREALQPCMRQPQTA